MRSAANEVGDGGCGCGEDCWNQFIRTLPKRVDLRLPRGRETVENVSLDGSAAIAELGLWMWMKLESTRPYITSSL